jgi:hypothetical protein
MCLSSVLLNKVDDRRFNFVDRDASHASVSCSGRRNDSMPGTSGCSTAKIGGPKESDYRGPDSRRHLHRSRVVAHQQSQPYRHGRETRDIHIGPNHRKAVLSSLAEFFSDRFFAGPDHNHRLVTPGTQTGGELTEALHRPAFGFTTRGCRCETYGTLTINAYVFQRRRTLVREAKRQFGAPGGIHRFESENPEDRVGIMYLMATAVNFKGSRHQNLGTLTSAPGAPASAQSDEDLPSRGVTEGDPDIKSPSVLA